MEQTRIFTALKGVRGRPAVDLAKLERVLVQFSLLVAEQPWIKEIDINPFVVSAAQMLALDARIVLHHQSVRKEVCRAWRFGPIPYNISVRGNFGTELRLSFDRSGLRMNL